MVSIQLLEKVPEKIAGKLSTISLNNLIFNFVKNMDLNNLLSLFQMFCKKDFLMKRQRLINMERQEIEEKESVLEYLRLKREKEYKNKIKEDEERENLRR